jgi:hypothetical protein
LWIPFCWPSHRSAEPTPTFALALLFTISHPFKDNQEIPRMDWEDFIRQVMITILKTQSPEQYVDLPLGLVIFRPWEFPLI